MNIQSVGEKDKKLWLSKREKKEKEDKVLHHLTFFSCFMSSTNNTLTIKISHFIY